MTNLDGSQQFLNKRYPTVISLFARRFVPKSLQFLFRTSLNHYEMRDLNQNENFLEIGDIGIAYTNN